MVGEWATVALYGVVLLAIFITGFLAGWNYRDHCEDLRERGRR